MFSLEIHLFQLLKHTESNTMPCPPARPSVQQFYLHSNPFVSNSPHIFTLFFYFYFFSFYFAHKKKTSKGTDIRHGRRNYNTLYYGNGNGLALGMAHPQFSTCVSVPQLNHYYKLLLYYFFCYYFTTKTYKSFSRTFFIPIRK